MAEPARRPYAMRGQRAGTHRLFPLLPGNADHHRLRRPRHHPSLPGGSGPNRHPVPDRSHRQLFHVRHHPVQNLHA